MGTVLGFGAMVWVTAVAIGGFCLVISPLMIWKHTKATSRKLDKLISLCDKQQQSPS